MFERGEFREEEGGTAKMFNSAVSLGLFLYIKNLGSANAQFVATLSRSISEVFQKWLETAGQERRTCVQIKLIQLKLREDISPKMNLCPKNQMFKGRWTAGFQTCVFAALQSRFFSPF